MSGCEFVTLEGGLTVPLHVLQVLWNLEDRGVHLRLEGADLIVNPRERLTDDDRQNLRRWKPHIKAVIDYCQQERSTRVH